MGSGIIAECNRRVDPLHRLHSITADRVYTAASTACVRSATPTSERMPLSATKAPARIVDAEVEPIDLSASCAKFDWAGAGNRMTKRNSLRARHSRGLRNRPKIRDQEPENRNARTRW